MTTVRHILPLAECQDPMQAGGKAVNLGRLIRAGFPVPEGFVLTTGAFRHARAHSAPNGAVHPPAELLQEVVSCYRAMGGGLVAVRSSATAEDMADASMAGQYETYLNIEGETALRDAIVRCWASLYAPRIRAYFADRGIDESRVAMAVVIQRQVPADVAGVLFTVNPHNGKTQEMLIEASWGLGESVVSGRVQPDVLHVAQDTGKVIRATIADKHVRLAPGSQSEEAVEESRRRQACLGETHVRRLWELGLKASAHFGAPQDIEWAIHREQLFLLQSRPITTLGETRAREEMLTSTRQRLREELAAGRGPWVLHNLGETLPHPTPLTWSVICRFMSGAGGFGEMYRLAGFEPSAAVERDGFLERIAGRIYMDAARAPEMFFAGFPFAYDVELLKRCPDAAQSPPTLPRGSLGARLAAGRRLAAVSARLRSLSADFDRQLREQLFPSIRQYVAGALQTPLATVDTERLIELWLQYEDQVMDSQAPQLLLPSLICGMALEELRVFLAEHLYNEDADELARLISSAGDGTADLTLQADSELHEVGRGTRPLEVWLAAHGHRAAGEFDLAAPRWQENHQIVMEQAARLAAGESPMVRHQAHGAMVQQRIAALRAGLGPLSRREFDRRVDLLRRYISFREDGKNYLMLGYNLLRTVALEAARRLRLDQDVFFLTRDELFDALRAGGAPQHLIAQRKLAFRAESRLELPAVIDAAAVEQLGEAAAPPRDAEGSRALALSAGQATGKARIVISPTDPRDLGKDYILVCPSTDPSWTPLFARAAGLVLERGGALSHGAVVAREMGLPAVVLPDATRRFADGQEIRLDGSAGWVGPAQQTAPPQESEDPQDPRVAASLRPPPPGSRDRSAARLRNIAALIWLVFLAGFFALPESWVRRPTMEVLDAGLWPLVRTLGKPGTVAAVAVGIALITLLLQRFCTDNARLREAKRRAALLQKHAGQLPADSPRRKALLALAAPVSLRTLMAAMVPIGLLLGPLVLPFVWFNERIDPAAWNAPAGSAVEVVAMVDGQWDQPVTIRLAPPAQLDAVSPAQRTLPPIRETLEHLLALYGQTPVAGEAVPWELSLAPEGPQVAEELDSFLRAGVPPQGLTWLIRTPENYSGRFPVTLEAGNTRHELQVVVGDDHPPSPSRLLGSEQSPIREMRVVYPAPKVRPAFWQPLPGVTVGWLLLYILVYVPVLMLARWALKVA